MVRSARARRESETNLYHVVTRGVGHQIIFEDNNDRQRYLHLLKNTVADHNGEIIAWCLMDNHTHSLLRMRLPDLSETMRTINSAYAMHFNKKYERIGHLMQGRFKSEPINSDQYLLTVLRYIHQNPEKANLAKTEKYPWSSYHEYVNEATMVNTSFMLNMFGGVAEFRRFHKAIDNVASCVDEDRGRRIFDDESALRAARTVLAPIHIEEVAALPKVKRDETLFKLKQAKLSIRQIERFTGISKSIVAKAKA